MSEPENIVKFREQSMRVLAALYANHPQKIVVSPETARGRPASEGIGNPEVDTVAYVTDPENRFAQDTLDWLFKNGYFEGRSFTHGHYLAQLNPRSWDALGAPDPMVPTRSIGSALVEWSKKPASEMAVDALKAASDAALSAIAKALGIGRT